MKDPFRFDASTDGRRYGRAASDKKGRERSMNYLGIASWNWQLPGRTTTTGATATPAPAASASAHLRQEGGALLSAASGRQTCQTAAILSPSSSSSPPPSSSSSFGWERQTRSSRRSATVLRIYFNLTATAERASCPICPRLATGVLQGSKDFLGGKLLQTRLKYCVITGRFGTGYAT